MRFRLLLLGLGALALWIGADLTIPVHGSLRQFDARAVARMETGMWRAYYEHRPLRLFGELAALLRTEYHLPLWRSYLGAYHAARGALVFQRGHNRDEYNRALPDIRDFYRLIRRAGDVSFDVDRAARLELEWWIIHREAAAHPVEDLEGTLADLQAAVYLEPASRFEEHAHARAEAMRLRDRRAAAGGVTEADWRRIEGLLEVSWRSLRRAVNADPVRVDSSRCLTTTPLDRAS